MLNAAFSKHSNHAGSTRWYTHSGGNYRYHWIRFGSPLKNEISSIFGQKVDDNDYRIISYSGRNFNNKYIGLNVNGSWAQLTYVGGRMNDTIESALLVKRSTSPELNINVKSLLSNRLKDKLDDVLSGSPASRVGSPKVYALMWPGHAPDKKLIRIEQKIRIDVPNWAWDYDAKIKYDVYLYKNSSGKLRGYVSHWHYWIEGGVWTSKIADVLRPQVINGMSTLNSELQSVLSMYSGFSLQSMYILPGNPPGNGLWYEGHQKDNATVVLVL